MLKPNRKPDNQTNALPLNACLAKTYKAITGEYLAGRHVLNHIHIVGEVAKELLNRMPPWLVAELFPTGSELIAAAHDIGVWRQLSCPVRVNYPGRFLLKNGLLF